MAFHVERGGVPGRKSFEAGDMTLKKRRLGKGLESLIGENGGRGAGEIPLSRIELNPCQPRMEMDEEGLEELTSSISASGVLQPVVVRPAAGGMYELVMGERRLRAARRAGLESVPAIVRDVDDREMLELALVENVQRRDLNPIEKARALSRMCGELGYSLEEAAGRIGLKRPTVSNLIRLLDLSPEVQEMVSRGTISAGHARAVLSAPPEARHALARKIAAGGLSVRAAERLAATSAGPADNPPGPGAGGAPAHIQRLEAILSESLGTEVRIRSTGKRGRIVLTFSGHEEFERIFAALTGEDEMPV